MVQKVTDTEFSEVIASNKKVVVKYFANWCGSCRLFAPKYTKISNKEEYSDIVFIEVNAEENPQARKFGGVVNLPFFATIKDGSLLKGDSIAKEEPLESMIKELLA
ncbi:MAG: thioredoxin family protein [Bacteroidetes bacterium]|nr:thioredoxin family protein [Bacteroidota bacterium]